MRSIFEHYETYLGEIQGGWSKSADGAEVPFLVVECRGGVLKGVTAFATLGLSRHGLRCANSDKIIHHELLLTAHTSFGKKNIPALLQQIGIEAVERGFAYLRGDVMGPRGKLFAGKEFEGIYFSIPVCLPDEFAAVATDEGDAVAIAWLVPITRAEAKFVREHGWGEFESLLESKDPDLFDFDRASVVA
jgi:hypothetical protein